MKKIILIVTLSMLLVMLTGCGQAEESPLDHGSPVEITLWHYYTGVLQTTFDLMVLEFNQTIGLELGIIVEAIGFGNMGVLETNIRSSAVGEANSLPLPQIFSAFPDTAYLPQRLNLLVDLDELITPEQLGEYFSPFIDRGRMGANNELRIFPVAMSAEIMLINETDWLEFADDAGFTYDDLRTMERLVKVAQEYYNWSGGKAFWGRDAMANMFIIGSKMFGTEIFEISQQNGEARAEININEQAMRRFWDYYYTPFISGYFAADANFRTDDVRVGDLIAFVGSTASAAFFPESVAIDGDIRNIRGRALPPPSFEGATNVLIKQGAGKVVMNSTEAKEYASVVFLRWFTEPEQNLRFSAASGRIPVRLEAMDVDLIRQSANEAGLTLTDITYQTLQAAIEAVKTNELYSTCAFTGAVEARAILTGNLRRKAENDREYVLQLIESGVPRQEAIERLAADENFFAWIEELETALVAAVN